MPENKVMMKPKDRTIITNRVNFGLISIAYIKNDVLSRWE